MPKKTHIYKEFDSPFTQNLFFLWSILIDKKNNTLYNTFEIKSVNIYILNQKQPII